MGAREQLGRASLGRGSELDSRTSRSFPRWLLRIGSGPYHGLSQVTRRSASFGLRRQWDLRETSKRWTRRGRLDFKIRYQSRQTRPAPLAVLWDVSGSMNSYVPLYFPWLYRLHQVYPRVGVFPFGTDLEDMTPRLDGPYARVLRDVEEHTRVWSSGTTIGQVLQRWIQQFGASWLGHRTTLLIISDGWDVGPPEILEEALRRIRADVAKLVWMNPLMATPGFEPKTRALRAALKYTDLMTSGDESRRLLELGWRLGYG